MHTIISKLGRSIRCSIRRALVGLAVLLCAPAAFAIDYSILNNCQSMERLFALVQKKVDTKCVNARSKIEREMISRVPGDYKVICILDKAPLQFLSSFDCFTPLSRTALLCTRPIKMSALRDYLDHYEEKYAADVASYLDEARRCSVSNGDAAVMNPDPFLGIFLPWIARPSVAWRTMFGAGKGAKASGSAEHGFAELDPSLKAGEAVEFFTIGISEPAAADILAEADEGELIEIGNWKVLRQNELQLPATLQDDFDALMDQVESVLGDQVTLLVRAFDVERVAGLSANAPLLSQGQVMSGLRKDLPQWGKAAVAGLEQSDFEPMDPTTIDRIFSNAGNAGIVALDVPYALKDTWVRPRPAMLFTRRQCQENAEGAIISMVQSQMHMDDGQLTGSVVLIAILAGDCDRSSTRKHARDAFDNAEDFLTSYLERHQ